MQCTSIQGPLQSLNILNSLHVCCRYSSWRRRVGGDTGRAGLHLHRSHSIIYKTRHLKYDTNYKQYENRSYILSECLDQTWSFISRDWWRTKSGPKIRSVAIVFVEKGILLVRLAKIFDFLSDCLWYRHVQSSALLYFSWYFYAASHFGGQCLNGWLYFILRFLILKQNAELKPKIPGLQYWEVFIGHVDNVCSVE
jgi:hypothetical protein